MNQSQRNSSRNRKNLMDEEEKYKNNKIRDEARKSNMRRGCRTKIRETE
jgi:hypothetical protein